MSYESLDEWEQQGVDDSDFIERLNAFLVQNNAEITAEGSDVTIPATVTVARDGREILSGWTRLPKS